MKLDDLEDLDDVYDLEDVENLSVELLETELHRVVYKKRFKQVLRSTIYTLITVAAVAILISTIFLPVLRIYGVSMTPTFQDGDIAVCVKNSSFDTGDVVAFYFNNKILVKRVIAQSGQWIDIDENGNVSVDHEPIYEPYLTEKALGECSIELPYQVPEGRYFVMGDHRSTSADSRSKEIGCISQEAVVGKIAFRVWPIEDFGLIK